MTHKIIERWTAGNCISSAQNHFSMCIFNILIWFREVIVNSERQFLRKVEFKN